MFYCGEQHNNAHGAKSDVLATVKVFNAQLAKYHDLPHTVSELHEYCNPKQPEWIDSSGKLKWSNNEVAINFGKKRGKKLKEIISEDPGFVKWLLNSDFPPDTKEIVRQAAYENKWPVPPDRA